MAPVEYYILVMYAENSANVALKAPNNFRNKFSTGILLTTVTFSSFLPLQCFFLYCTGTMNVCSTFRGIRRCENCERTPTWGRVTSSTPSPTYAPSHASHQAGATVTESFNKGTMSLEGYFLRCKDFTQYFLFMRWRFQGLQKLFTILNNYLSWCTDGARADDPDRHEWT